MDASTLAAIRERYDNARPDDKHSLTRDEDSGEPWAWQDWSDIGDLLDHIAELEARSQVDVVLLRGLPASGKTRLARQLQARNPVIRVNRDDLRAMLHGAREWGPADEIVTARVRDAAICQALMLGRPVIVDDTNIEKHTADHIRALAKSFGIEPVIYDVDTPLELCIHRDAARERPVGESKIRRMAEQLAKTKAEEAK